MDRATALANGEQYLDDHLADVVAGLEGPADMEIYGVGFGLDLSPDYRRCRTIGTLEGSGYRIFREITGLLAGAGRDRSRPQGGRPATGPAGVAERLRSETIP